MTKILYNRTVKEGGDVMYINYNKLWKLLLDKKITKNDLCEMTGMSTRTLAKLVKNQSVTTDTLLRICEILNCELFDILEISKEESHMTIYEAYKQHGILKNEDEYCRLTEFEHNGKQFLVKEVKKNATKRVVIHCKNNSVMWEQLYPSGFSAAGEARFITDFSFVESGKICILLISGSCVGITGLDEGQFLSANRPYEDNKLYVMSKAKFKLFAI